MAFKYTELEISDELEICYFCENTDVSCITFGNKLFACSCCTFTIKKLNTIKENDEQCPICFEIKKTIELSNCNHRLCLECYKIIYFGKSNKKNIPIHPLKINVNTDSPKWPYQIFAKKEEEEEEEEEEKKEKKEKEEEEYKKFILYFDFKDKNLDFSNKKIKKYEDLLKIRDNLIPKREEWMNTEIFINYENKVLKKEFEIKKAEKNWEKYKETKKIYKQKCTLCRS